MSNNTIIFLRHAETKVDPNLIMSKWNLTKEGIKTTFKLFKNNLFNDVDIIITSNEEKACQTAYPLAQKLDKNVIRVPNLNEIFRDNGKFLNKEEYNKIMELCMTYRNQSFNNCETADNALKRFSKQIEEIDGEDYNKKILIVSHGGVINLYFANRIGKLDKVFKRFLSSSFCDYGIIQNGKIIKDIAKIP